MASIFGYGRSESRQQYFEYYYSMRYALCMGGIDELIKIEVNNKTLPESENLNINGFGDVSKEVGSLDLFGDRSREGGFLSEVQIRDGRPSQGIDNYFVDNGMVSASNEPAYRNLTTVSFKDAYIGNSPRVGNLIFWAKRTQRHVDYNSMWNSHISNINGDMNPVHIIYELITQRFGMGLSTSYIGTSFATVAQQLFNEGFGLSFYWTKSRTVEDFIKEILKTIDGYMYFKHDTQTFELILLRVQTNTTGLFEISDTNNTYKRFIKRSKSELEDLITHVEVKYTDFEQDNDKSSVLSEDLGMVYRIGRVKKQDFDFSGITKRNLAMSVASRELTKLSKKREAIDIECTILTDQVKVGELVLLTVAELGYTQKAYRVVSKTKKGFFEASVVLSLLEDIWVDNYVVETDNDSQAILPSYANPTDTISRVDNITYYQLAQALGDADARLKDGSEVAYIHQSLPVYNFYKYRLNIDGTTKIATYEFAGALLIDQAVSKTDTIISFSDSFKASRIFLNRYYYINNEIVYVTNVDYNNLQVTIERGLLDTYPQEHAIGSYLWCTQPNYAIHTDGILAESKDVKFLTVSNGRQLAESSATTYNITLTDRYYRPYPPKNIKINAKDILTDSINVSNEDIEITFASRNRISETGAVFLNYYDGSTTLEEFAKNKVVLEFFVGGVSQGTLTRETQFDTVTITPTDTLAVVTAGNYDVVATFSGVRDGLESYQGITKDFTYSNDVELDADITISMHEKLDADITINVQEL